MRSFRKTQRMKNPTLTKKDKDKTKEKNNSVDIFLVTDCKDNSGENNENTDDAPSKLTVKTYTGRLNNKRPAAIVKFTAIKDKPSAAKETHE